MEEHLLKTYSDALRHESLQERADIPAVPLPTSSFCLASPSLEEVRGAVRKARNRSAPGTNGVPYLLYKRCPKTLYLLHSLIQKAWSSVTVDDEWKKAEGVYIPKEKDSKGLNQFRPISLLNVEGENIFLLHGIEAHGVRDVESVRRHFQSKREAFQVYPVVSSIPR